MQRIKSRAIDPRRHNADITVEAAKIWKSLSKEQQKPYVVEADRLHNEHKLKYPNYKYKPRQKRKLSKQQKRSIIPYSKDESHTKKHKPSFMVAPIEYYKRDSSIEWRSECDSLSDVSSVDTSELPWYETFDLDTTHSDLISGETSPDESVPEHHTPPSTPRAPPSTPLTPPSTPGLSNIHTVLSGSGSLPRHRSDAGDVTDVPLLNMSTEPDTFKVETDFSSILVDVGLPDFASM